MGFELFIAAKRAPLERPSSGEAQTAPPVSCTTLTLNGALDEAAVTSVLSTVSDLSAKGSESVLIDMEGVSATDATALQKLGSGLMSLRAAGVHVQADAREPSLHRRMSELADARDWLLSRPYTNATGARRAIHLDGPHG